MSVLTYSLYDQNALDQMRVAGYYDQYPIDVVAGPAEERADVHRT